jgi:hypothetical protein
MSSVRGYVWRDKFYGTIQTESYILQVTFYIDHYKYLQSTLIYAFITHLYLHCKVSFFGHIYAAFCAF